MALIRSIKSGMRISKPAAWSSMDLNFGIQNDSWAAFQRFRSAFHHPQTKDLQVDSPCTIPLLGKLYGSSKNLEMITKALTQIAATQPVLRLQFNEAFVFPNPEKDDHTSPDVHRSVQYGLMCSDFTRLYGVVTQALGDVRVFRDPTYRLKKLRAPPLPLVHMLSEKTRYTPQPGLRTSVARKSGRARALEILEEARTIDASTEFGTLLADRFQIRIQRRSEDIRDSIPSKIIDIPFLGAK